ncbi:MAG: DUF370 domain-containing protein [Clostridia bacterium]|nr:DUF370 domain-containing protein [Clostridia bacterium]MBQ4435099.1 DUF370 domain-containing protein [Clostridia bacterium]MBQ6325077.1 DUF370 domain-containing protein [Clostridia bacterium]
MKNAKEHKLHFDLSFGRTTKALILLEDGRVVSCALTPRTIGARIDAIPGDGIAEGENEHEDHQADGEDTGSD